MAGSDNHETSPLLANSSPSTRKNSTPTRPPRNVTFNPQIDTNSPPRAKPVFPPSLTGSSGFVGGLNSSSRDGGQPMLSALNSKLRRRNSQGAPHTLPPITPLSKIGPQRTTRTAQKLKLLPNPEHGEDGLDEESGREVYSQFTRIKDPTARRDAARLGKEDRARLPRVTAFCTANSYRLDDLMRYLKGRSKTKSAAPKLFDECIYTPYLYSKPERQPEQESRIDVHSTRQRRFSDSAIEVEENAERRREDLINLHQEHIQEGSLAPGDSSTAEQITPVTSNSADQPDIQDFDTSVHVPEIFLFEYGVVVIWGMSVKEEQRFLKELAKFEVEKLAKDDVQVENFNFYYTREYQARIYNDFISLREKKNYMTKLAISHALAQSTKTSLYEDLVDNTIDTTKEIPATIALTGRVKLTRKQINMQIGELFILRINIHLQGSVLDAPELMWAEPQLEPVYQAVRSYLEMDQRVGLLTERLNVIADLLQVLKDQLSHSHGEYLEWIVILLIGAEIIVACINIIVDLYAGVD